MCLKKRSFAKINLFLQVTGKRPDGFHDLCSLMTQIDLHDEVEICFKGKGIGVVCDYPGVPQDETNLAYRAAHLFLDAFEQKKGSPLAEGVSIHIRKKVPPGGGLGGGSSNAATVLMALNEKGALLFDQQELMHLGLKLGADVPFFILGSPALATGVGEKLVKYPDLPFFYLVLCCPGVSASTAAVFKNMDLRLTSEPEYNKNTGLNALSRGGGPEGLKADGRDEWHNDLESSACRLYPEIASAKQEMELMLQRKVYMSGSGSSLFALFSRLGPARKGYELLAQKWEQGPKKVFLSSVRR